MKTNYPQTQKFLGSIKPIGKLQLPQISTLIMDLHPTYQIPTFKQEQIQIAYHIQKFINTVNLILALGQDEHTGDWDPYLEITLKSGIIITTENGYNHMEITKDQTLLQIEDESGAAPNGDGDSSYHLFPLNQITKIKLLT